jgi:hypothetical protein
MAIALLTRSEKNSILVEGHEGMQWPGLSRNQLPHAFVGRHISVVDEQGIVVFKVPLYSRDP